MISVDVRQFNVDQQQNLKDKYDSVNRISHIVIFPSLWGLLYTQYIGKRIKLPNNRPALWSCSLSL